VEDLDGEVLLDLTQDVLVLLLDDLAGPVMRVDDVVTDGEVDALDLAADVQVFELVGIGADGALLGRVGPVGPPTGLSLGLQVTVHEVDLLQPAKALADVLRTDLPHAFDGLQLGVRRGEDLVEPAELADDVLHHEARKPRGETG
jgi:hypothetical protein